MVKDYAKYAAAQYEPAKSGIPFKGLLGLLLVVIIALTIFFHPWRPDEAVQGEAQDLTPVDAMAVPDVDTPQVDPTFDFYDILTSSDDEMPGVTSQVALSPIPKTEAKVDEAPVVNVTQPKKVETVAPEKTASAALTKTVKKPVKKVAVEKASTTTKRYMISLGEYTQYKDAQKHRAALILNGVDVNLTKIGSKYRLETGPYDNWRQAHTAQLTLEQQQQIRGKIVQ